MKKYLKTLRPKHWIKNLFIFAPAFFALKLFQENVLWMHLLVFGQFSLLAGAVYTLNDILDYDSDRLDEKKQDRPIINGSLSRRSGLYFHYIVLFIVWASALLLDQKLFMIYFAYWLINLIYSLNLKNVVILDAMVIAFGFILRLLAGSVLIRVALSHWIIIITFLLALFLAFGKRRAELQSVQSRRQVLAHYSKPFLDLTSSMLAALIILAYIFYTISDDVILRFGTGYLIYTSLFVIYGFLRYFYLMHIRHLGENPAEIFFSDWPTMVNFLLWAVSFYLIIQL